MRRNRIAVLAALSMLLVAVLHAENETPQRDVIRWDFRNSKLEKGIPTPWTFQGKGWTPAPSYSLVRDRESGSRVLQVFCDKASGILLIDLSKINLEEYPIMRWRWKVSMLPSGADGRVRAKDDQAISLYVGYGRITQKSIAYMWQTETPKGATGNAVYHGLVDVFWTTLRNKEDGLNRWYEEERNLCADLKRYFKSDKLPGGLALSISANSQYTKSQTSALIEYIEFSKK